MAASPFVILKMAPQDFVRLPDSTNFRINAKGFFLTYTHCELDKQFVIDELQQKKGFADYLIARETHEDGSHHLHALIYYEREFNCRDSRFFDITLDGTVYHPNIGSVRSKPAAIRYLCKEDPNPEGTLQLKRKWSDVLKAENKQEFYDLVKCVDPKAWVLQHQQVLSFAEQKFKEEIPYEARYTDFINDDIFDEYIDQMDNERPRSLMVISPSRYGKTEWARSLDSDHSYFNGMFNLDDFKENSKYAIFDDISWEWLRWQKGFIGAQRQFTITDKYRKKRTVSWGKSCIILLNELPELTDWHRANLIIIELGNKLY